MSSSAQWQDYVAASSVLGSLDAEETRRRSEIEKRYVAAIANARIGTNTADAAAAVTRALKGAETALSEVFSMFDKPPGPISEDQPVVVLNAAAMQREAKDVEAWSAQAVTTGRSLARTLSRIRAEERREMEELTVSTPEPAHRSDPGRALMYGLVALIILASVLIAALMILF